MEEELEELKKENMLLKNKFEQLYKLGFNKIAFEAQQIDETKNRNNPESGGYWVNPFKELKLKSFLGEPILTKENK